MKKWIQLQHILLTRDFIQARLIQETMLDDEEEEENEEDTDEDEDLNDNITDALTNMAVVQYEQQMLRVIDVSDDSDDTDDDVINF
jgi:hypothetical protein